nr:MAG TPA: hypothetical protein [Caudoviricetes sp.]
MWWISKFSCRPYIDEEPTANARAPLSSRWPHIKQVKKCPYW